MLNSFQHLVYTYLLEIPKRVRDDKNESVNSHHNLFRFKLAKIRDDCIK